MVLFGLFKRKLAHNQNPDWETARERSLQTRQDNAEIRRLEHQTKILDKRMAFEEKQADYDDLREELAIARGEDEEEQPSSPWETIGLAIAEKFLSGGTIAPQQQTEQQTEQQTGFPDSHYNEQPIIHNTVTSNNSNIDVSQDLTDEEIVNLLSQIPKKLRKQLSKLPEGTVTKLTRARLPALSDETCKRAYQLLLHMT